MPHNNSILKTKFFLPQSTADFVERKNLFYRFEKLQQVPIMLVSAATGFGKSTVVSAFLTNQNEDYAWLSLSERDDEFQQFVVYFIKAVQMKIQNFGVEVLELINAPNPLPSDEIGELILNDLAELTKHLYLALDDYHLIRNNDIHQFISKLFEYPQPYFRLIIITRRDPQLPFSVWRSKNKLIEIRSGDLRFNRSEISEFYNRSIFYSPEDNVLTKIEKATEGWISGLRMLLLSADNGEAMQQNALNFNYKNSSVIKELVDTVLNNQSAAIKDMLLRISILKEFNVDLFSELCLEEGEKNKKVELFNEFTSELVRTNMFIIALDDKHNWHRFHHLFKEQLYELLFAKYDIDIINGLRLKAADWFYNNSLLEDAIEYLLSAGKESKALVVFTEYRLKLISETRFELLEKIYNMFPKKLIETNGILLVTKGWIILHKGDIQMMAKHIEPLEDTLKKEDYSEDLLGLLTGEIHAMKSFDRYLGNVDMHACLEHCKSAIKLLNGRNPYALGMAWVYYGAVMQHLGKPVAAKEEIHKVLEETGNVVMKGHLLLILCFLDWFEGNLGDMIKTAEHLLQLGNESQVKMVMANGNMLAGIAYYYQSNDEKAFDYLLKSHELRQYTYLHMSFATGMALADIKAKTQNVEEMHAIVQAYMGTALKQGGILFKKITKSALSDFKSRYLNDSSGLKWARQNDFNDFLPLANLYSPELVQARILALDDDLSSQKLAQDILNIIIPFFEDRNDINVLIRAFIIQVMIYVKTGDSDKALETLNKVLSLSSAGPYIRPYLEFGEPMKFLLEKCEKTTQNNIHIDEILEQFEKVEHQNEQVILTLREKEVLNLGEKRTNKEVGNQLFISEKTVKGHITNINKKLNVNSKLEAITKAKDLNLI